MDEQQEKRLRELAQSSVVGADIRVALDEIDALRNRRTEPSPAEVGSEGLPEPELYSGENFIGMPVNFTIEKATNGAWQRGWYSDATVRKLLSQQSPARVEGELKDAFDKAFWAIRQADDAGLARKVMVEFFALNQRLAVKEGEAPYPDFRPQLARLRAAAERLIETGEGESEYEQAEQEAFNALAFDAHNAAIRYSAPLSAHPVSDDQQAKDAALLRDLLEDARDDVNECLNGMMHLAGYPSGDKKIAQQREFLARIDAALSTTKQDEV